MSWRTGEWESALKRRVLGSEGTHKGTVCVRPPGAGQSTLRGSRLLGELREIQEWIGQGQSCRSGIV